MKYIVQRCRMYRNQERHLEGDRTRWKDSCNVDMESVGLEVEDLNGQYNMNARNPKLIRQPEMMGKP